MLLILDNKSILFYCLVSIQDQTRYKSNGGV